LLNFHNDSNQSPNIGDSKHLTWFDTKILQLLGGHGFRFFAYAVDGCARAAYAAWEFEIAHVAKFRCNTWLRTIHVNKNARKHIMSKKITGWLRWPRCHF